MKVRSGAKPGGKLIEVELDEDDVRREIPDWDSKTSGQRWRILTDRADILIVEYMLRRGDISREFAETRIREIKGQT